MSGNQTLAWACSHANAIGGDKVLQDASITRSICDVSNSGYVGALSSLVLVKRMCSRTELPRCTRAQPQAKPHRPRTREACREASATGISCLQRSLVDSRGQLHGPDGTLRRLAKC